MNRPVPLAFHTKLEELKKIIEQDNVTGNLNGLFSHYVLDAKSDFQWKTAINDDWLEQNTETIIHGNFIQLATLGYSLFLGEGKAQYIKTLSSGLNRLKSKDAFPGDRISFPFYPREFLGLALGIDFLDPNEREERKKWLFDILSKRESMDVTNPLHKIMYQHIGTILSKSSIEITSDVVTRARSYAEICFIYWGMQVGSFRISDKETMTTMRKRILTGFLEEDISSQLELTPIIYSSAKSCLIESLDPAILSPDHVSRLLNNFESAMRRWPWSEKKKWPINDEHDVQSVIWLILRSAFDDVIDEEPTERLGHGYSLIDFRIPSLKLLVEVKFIRKREDFQRIENEIKIDSINYLKTTDCNELIVFIYDNSSSVEDHQITIHSLKKINGIRDVIIVSRPSHLGSV